MKQIRVGQRVWIYTNEVHGTVSMDSGNVVIIEGENGHRYVVTKDEIRAA